MQRVARRTVLSGIGSTLLMPFIPRVGFAADTDVVIVGAGSAGIAAARVLSEKGINFVILEAKNQIGGRAFTDTKSFGKPFDLGCTFQHQSEKNPYVSYARSNNFPIGPLPADENTQVWISGSELTGDQYEDIERRYQEYKAATEKAGRAGRDISVAQAVSSLPKTKYDKMVGQWLVPGSEPAKISVLDWWNGVAGTDQFSPAGYGTIVRHFGRNLKVSLNTEVKQIDWSGSGVKVTTNKGTIDAKQCIVTVSNGVLASGAIKISPGLTRRDEAVRGIPMAHYTTVGLKFAKRKVLPAISNSWLHSMNDQNTCLSWMGDIGGSGVLRMNILGDQAAQIEGGGEKATTAFAVAELKKVLGSASVPRLQRAVASSWSRDPHVLGAWSAASPGFGKKRAELRKSAGERLHFAGEACHENMYGTCHGARLSGEKVARAVVAKVR